MFVTIIYLLPSGEQCRLIYSLPECQTVEDVLAWLDSKWVKPADFTEWFEIQCSPI